MSAWTIARRARPRLTSLANGWAARGRRSSPALSSSRFAARGSAKIGFRRALRARDPTSASWKSSEGLGIDAATRALVRKALAADPEIAGAYSIGGGDRSVSRRSEAMGRKLRAFIGHDLDADDLVLREGKSRRCCVMYLRADMRSACRFVIQAHRVLPRSAPRRHRRFRSSPASTCPPLRRRNPPPPKKKKKRRQTSFRRHAPDRGVSF